MFKKCISAGVFSVFAAAAANADSTQAQVFTTYNPSALGATPVRLNLDPVSTVGCVNEGGYLAAAGCWRLYGGSIVTIGQYDYFDENQNFEVHAEMTVTSGAEPWIFLQIYRDGALVGESSMADYADSGTDTFTSHTVSKTVVLPKKNGSNRIQVFARSKSNDAIVWSGFLSIQPIDGVAGTRTSTGTLTTF